VTSPSIPLWRQLQSTAQVLLVVRNGRSLTQVLDDVDRTLRPGVQALAFHVMRVQGRAQALRRELARRAPPPAVDALLCTALALAADSEEAPYEAFTLVDQAVEAAKRDPSLRPSASFINACLRRFLRERERLMAATDADPVARWNHPAWWIKRLKADHPLHWEAILAANNAKAPMALRVNVARIAPAHYLQVLEAAGLAAVRQGETAILLERALPVQDIPGFTDGLVSVQDAGAQLAAPLLLQGLASQRPAGGCWMPALHQVARLPICWSREAFGSPRWTSTRNAASVSRPTCSAWASARRSWPPTPGNRPGGGTGRFLTPSCSMRHALRRGSSGGIRTCAGCGAKAMLTSWRRCRPGC
jgi:16S rRNA (cytosine967-C5)-methyltransferase